MASFLYKPVGQGQIGRGNAVFLIENTGFVSGGLYDAQGTLVENFNRAQGPPEPGQKAGVKFYGSRPGYTYGENLVAKFKDSSGQEHVYNIDSGAQRYEGDYTNPGSLAAVNKADTGGYDPYGYGTLPNPYMMNFNPINYKRIRYKPIGYDPIGYSPIEYDPMETAPYEFVDPIEAAQRYNQFNLGQEENAYQTGRRRGQELTDLDTDATVNFANRMSGLQQNLVDSENRFNQAQRLKAVDFAMPDLRSTLDSKRQRGETYASGRLLSSAEDRAYQVAAQSASADGSFVRGFGDDSVFGRRTSDVLSAQQRLGISQMGEGILNDWVTQGSSILIDQPLKTSISQRLPSTPQILPSQQAAQQQSNLTNLSTVPLQFGISSEINQQQFGTNLEQGTRQFNTSNEFATDQFNAGNTLATDQFNAGNTFAKDQFNAGNTLATSQFNAGNRLATAQFNASGQFQASQAQFSGLQSNYQLATQASNRAEDIQRQDAHNAAASAAADQNIAAQQTAGNAGAGASIVGAIAGIAPYVPGIINAISPPAPAVAGGGSSGGQVVGSGPITGGQSMDSIMGSAPISSGPPSNAIGQNTDGSYIVPQGAVSVGTAPSSSSDGGGMFMRSGAPASYNGASIPVSEGPYDSTASAADVSQEMKSVGNFVSDMGASGPSTPQMSSLGQGIVNGATAGGTITSSFQSAATPEAQVQLTDQLHGAALGNASNPETRESVDNIFAQVREHLNTGVGVNGQAAGIAGFVKNYDQYSGPEKVRAITNISFTGQDLEENYGVKDLTSASLSRVVIPGTDGKMTMQDALSLANSGYNVSSLVDNWDDINEVHSTLNGQGNVLSVAATARSLKLIDNETPTMRRNKRLALRQAGATPAGAYGAGAVAVPEANKKAVENLGMVVVGKTSDGQNIAVGAASAASTGLSTGIVGSGMDSNGLKNMTPATLAVGQKAALVYENWDPNFIPKQQASMGSNPAVANGLYEMGATNPYLLGKVVMGGLEKGQVSQETNMRSANVSTQQQMQAVVASTQAVVNSAAQFHNQDAITAAPYVNAVAAGQQLYSVLNNPNATDKQKAEAFAAANQAGINIAAQAGNQTAGQVAPYANYAMAAYNTSKILDSDLSPEDKAKAMQRVAEDTAAAYFTFGLSSVAQVLDQQFFGGALNELREKFDEINPLSGLVGSIGGLFGSGKTKGTMAREGLRGSLQQSGMIDKDNNLTLASGALYNIGKNSPAKDREWFDPSLRRPDQTDVDKLGAWDLDYTRDLDGVMDVSGNALSMLMYGSDDPYVRQMGHYFTNAAVSDAGSPALTLDSYKAAQTNMQAFFTKAGIESKAEAYALANQMAHEGRISQTQLVTIHQGINLTFDQNGFQAANQLLEGVKLGRKGDDIKGTAAAAPKPAGRAPGPLPVAPASTNATSEFTPVSIDYKLPKGVPVSKKFKLMKVEQARSAELTRPMEIQNG